MLLIEPGKPRVRHFIMGHMRNPGSPLSRKLQSCPALACIAGNIPPKKLKGWNFSDEFYHARFKEIRLCLHGLIGHGACLAAHGSGEQLPALRDFICGLAAFWPDPFEEDDDPVVREEHYGALFDDAVSAAQNGVDVPELSEGRKENIIIGLENYSVAMTAADILNTRTRSFFSGNTDKTVSAGNAEACYGLLWFRAGISPGQRSPISDGSAKSGHPCI